MIGQREASRLAFCHKTNRVCDGFGDLDRRGAIWAHKRVLRRPAALASALSRGKTAIKASSSAQTFGFVTVSVGWNRFVLLRNFETPTPQGEGYTAFEKNRAGGSDGT